MSNLNRTNINTAAPAVPNPMVHTQATPLTGGMQNLSLKDKVVHEAERVINHAPIVEKQIVNERPVEVRREHHVQPIVHETEHRIQPIIKTQATTEQPIIEKDRNVMQAPIIERAALPAGLEAVERAGPEGILHKAKLEKQVLVEHPVEVRREHHVQPIIHEREHRIQPIIKTEATAERPVIEQDRNVIHAPIVERAALPAGLEAVERAGPEGIVHRAKLEKDVVVEHPVQVKHERHIQPIIHEREHHIQPIVKTEVTAAQPVIEQEREVLLPPIIEPTVLVSGPPLSALPANTVVNTGTTGLAAERGLAHMHKHGADVHAHKHADVRDSTAHHHAGVGQKLKGALKEVQGTITRNPAKKEEGKMLMHGTDSTATSSARTGI